MRSRRTVCELPSPPDVPRRKIQTSLVTSAWCSSLNSSCSITDMELIPMPCCTHIHYTSDVKSTRPKWPPGQHFGLGLGLKDLASASASASISLSYYVIGHFSGKNRVKFGNFVNFFSGNNLKSYVVNYYLVLFHNYFWPRPWPQPPEIGLGLVLVALASVSRFWPRLTSLHDTSSHCAVSACSETVLIQNCPN